MFSQSFQSLIRRNLAPFYLSHSVQFGARNSYSDQRVCLFSHFDRDSRLDDYVIHYLKSLADAGLSIVLISSCSSLDKPSMDIATRICSAVILRANRGYDFAGWALAIRKLHGILDAEEIVCANDSVYGPLRPLAPMFDEMNARGFPLWGVTSNFEIEHHLQSYFIVFKRPAITSPAFRSFWFDVRPLQDKWEIIKRYEVKLASFFRDRGIHADHYVRSIAGLSLNPTLDLWKKTLEGRSPFLKVQLLRDSSLGTDITGWEDEVKKLNFDSTMIKRHLDRTGAGTRSAARPTAPYCPRDPTLRLRAGMLSPR